MYMSKVVGKPVLECVLFGSAQADLNSIRGLDIVQARDFRLKDERVFMFVVRVVLP